MVLQRLGEVSRPLWPLRFGRGPTDELKAEVADRVLS
jgi:hypothetical protein